MKAAYSLILFDLDGTLIDTLEDLAAAVNQALDKRGFPRHNLSEYRSMVGHGVRNLVIQALPEAYRDDESFVDEVLADFTAWYSANIDVHTRPYPGIVDLLRDLHAAGVRMAVASNKFQAGTEALIRRFFPEIPFVAILGNRPGYPLKPDPEIVGEVLRASGLGREGAVLVGDSGTDMLTARNGGIPSIAVGWGYRPMSDSADYGFAGSVTALRNLLFDRPFYVSEPTATAPECDLTPLQAAIYQRFAELNIPFSRVDTDPGITMEDCAHIDAKLGARIVKTVFVCNRQQSEFYLYATQADKAFVTRDFCAALGIPRVSFAPSEKLQALTGVEPGATTLLSAVLPQAASVHLVMDQELADAQYFACTDGTASCFVKIATRDLLEKYLPACGHTPVLLP